MTTLTFRHEINSDVYAIRDCSNGSADVIQRGTIISIEVTASESNNSVNPIYLMTYTIKFVGDTFITEVTVPFIVTTSQSLLESQTEADYSFVAGSGYVVGDTVVVSDGSVVTVDAVGPVGSPVVTGTVTGFTLSTSSGATVSAGDTLTQLTVSGPAGSPATGGVGIGFSLTPVSANLSETGFDVSETENGSTLFDDKADAVAAYAILLP